MSTESKIEELEKKCAELSRSKNKAKVAYFKLKEEKEKLSKDFTDLQTQLSTLNETLKTQSEESIKTGGGVSELTKQAEEGKDSNTAELDSQTNKFKEEIEELKQEISDLENVIGLKRKQESIYMDTIKELKEELSKRDSMDCTERENKKRKQDNERKERLAEERARRILELRIEDFKKKRNVVSQVYAEMEEKYEKLMEEKDARMRASLEQKDAQMKEVNGEVENELSKMTNLLSEKSIPFILSLSSFRFKTQNDIYNPLSPLF